MRACMRLYMYMYMLCMHMGNPVGCVLYFGSAVLGGDGVCPDPCPTDCKRVHGPAGGLELEGEAPSIDRRRRIIVRTAVVDEKGTHGAGYKK